MRNDCVPQPGKEWSEPERRDLLEFYIDGAAPFLMAQLFGCKVADVVKELGSLVLGASDIERDENAPNYGRPWDWHDDHLLQREYQLRRPLARIAKLLGRDPLGVAFRMLDMRPPIPQGTIKKYGLDKISKSIGPLEGDEPQFVKLCAECLDVPLYCKCQICDIGSK